MHHRDPNIDYNAHSRNVSSVIWTLIFVVLTIFIIGVATGYFSIDDEISSNNPIETLDSGLEIPVMKLPNEDIIKQESDNSYSSPSSEDEPTRYPLVNGSTPAEITE